MNKRKAIKRITDPDKVVKMIKYRMQGWTDYKIGKELHIAPINVNRILEHVREDWPQIRKFVKDVKKTNYFKMIYIKSLKGSERNVMIREKILLSGRPIPPGAITLGYKTVNGTLTVDPETAPKVRRIFEGYRDGENMAELFRDLKLPKRPLQPMMRNPIYIGKIQLKDKTFYFREIAIIDKKLWKECQPQKLKFSHKLLPVTIFGYKRKADRFVKDPETAPVVTQIFQMILRGKTLREIKDKINMSTYRIRRIVKNSNYTNKVKVNDKYLDGVFDVIIHFDKWLKVQEIIHSKKFRDRTQKLKARKMMKIGEDNRRRIFKFLDKHKPEAFTYREIMKEVKLSDSNVYKHLHSLVEAGVIEKIQSKRKRRGFVSFPSKWRRAE